jgi:hypothetical protein
MASTNPRTLVEEIFSDAIQSQLPEISVLIGQSPGERQIPCAIVYGASANAFSELPAVLGNYSVTLEILVISNADGENALENHRQLLSDVRDAAMNRDAIDPLLPEDALVYDIEFLNDDEDREDRKFGNTLSFDVRLCVDIDET